MIHILVNFNVESRHRITIISGKADFAATGENGHLSNQQRNVGY